MTTMRSPIYQKPHLILPGKAEALNSVQYVNVMVSQAVLAEFFINSGRAFAVTKGLPMDARLVRFEYDRDKGVFIATFEHPSFERSIIGRPLPVIEVEITAYEMLKEKPDEVALADKTTH